MAAGRLKYLTKPEPDVILHFEFIFASEYITPVFE
jgi:hypothetical protein